MSVGCHRSEQDGERDALGILISAMEFEEITSPVEIYQLTRLTLVNQSPKLSRVEDQLAVKLGGVIHDGGTDGLRNGCSLRESSCLAPHLILAERTYCCVFCMSHQNCHNHRQTSECW